MVSGETGEWQSQVLAGRGGEGEIGEARRRAGRRGANQSVVEGRPGEPTQNEKNIKSHEGKKERKAVKRACRGFRSHYIYIYAKVADAGGGATRGGSGSNWKEAWSASVGTATVSQLERVGLERRPE